MPISFTKYVNITSGVAGATAVKGRKFILRLFTTNPLVPSDSFGEFATAADVETYFGSNSDEYKRAAAYFSFISKNIRSPQLISFAAWAQNAIAPRSYGDTNNTYSLAQLVAITAGMLTMTLGQTTATVNNISFAGSANLAAVAATLQAAIRAANSDPQWTGATVTYNAQLGEFVLLGGVAGPGALSFAASPNAATGQDVAAAMGFLSVGAIVSGGSAATSITDTLTKSFGVSTNFGSVSFIPAFNEAQALEFAQFMATQNLIAMGLVPVTANTAEAIASALLPYAGMAVTLSPLPDEFPELTPAMVQATTDYDSGNNVSQNYMYQQPNFTPSVNDDADSAAYDNLRVNYVGSTQTAGELINFYQRGVLMGQGPAPTDMNIFANEIWIKSTVGDAVLSLLLAVNQISTNPLGRSQLLSVISGVAQKAITNGCISVGKTLTTDQLLVIAQNTGNNLAWVQVQSIGYYLDIEFDSYVTTDGRTEYEANYTLIYSKNDAIRVVNGSHALI